MRWFRYDKRIASCLALVALTVQLALPFEHVHLYGTDPAVAALDRYSHTSQSVLALQPGNTAGDDYCAICASIHLASNSFVPAAPQLPVPLVFHAVEHFNSGAADFVAPRRSAFQSRAPPLA